MTTKTNRIKFIPTNVEEFKYMYGVTYIWLDEAVEEIIGMYTPKGEYIESYTPPPFSNIK